MSVIDSKVDRLLRDAAARERAGEWQAAAQMYDRAVRAGVEARSVPSILEAYTKLGHGYRMMGNADAAEDVLELALALARVHCDHDRAARALNGLGIVRMQAGDLTRAEHLYRQALDTAHHGGTNRTTGEVEQNLGIVATIRGDVDAALAHYQAGYENLHAAGQLRACAGVLTNLGMLHVDLGRLDEADDYFRRSLEISSGLGDVLLEATAQINRTEMFLARGQPEKARASCDEAYELFSKMGEPEGRAEAMKFYGIIHRSVGKLHLAETYLRQGIEIGHAARFPLVEAESYRELSLVLRALNRNREALEALNRSHTLFTQLQAKIDQADINKRIGELENDFLSLVRFWGESIEAKDLYTSGHCERVAEYACRIAGEVGIGEREMVWFRMGAFLHDLGKTEVPEEILNKPGRLTDDERGVMERHTVIGDEMLAPVEFPWDIRPMVRSHHERWDGRGYPDGLAGDQIPLPARILRIADVFDALTTARSYRHPLTPDEALRIMEGDDGSFDPEVFGIFRRIFPELVSRAEEAQRLAVG